MKVKSACVYSNSYANFILANYYDGLFWEEHDHPGRSREVNFEHYEVLLLMDMLAQKVVDTRILQSCKESIPTFWSSN